jgi:hypothetical protein
MEDVQYGRVLESYKLHLNVNHLKIKSRQQSALAFGTVRYLSPITTFPLLLLWNQPPPNFCFSESYPIIDLDSSFDLQDAEASRISRLSAHESEKFVTTRQQPSLAPGIQPWYSFLLELESTPGP